MSTPSPRRAQDGSSVSVRSRTVSTASTAVSTTRSTTSRRPLSGHFGTRSVSSPSLISSSSAANRAGLVLPDSPLYQPPGLLRARSPLSPSVPTSPSPLRRPPTSISQDSRSSQSSTPLINKRLSLASSSAFGGSQGPARPTPSTAPSSVDRGVEGVEDNDAGTLVLSDVDDEVDQDMHNALRQVQSTHSRQMLRYKRLLSEKESASARSLHDLHGEIQEMTARLDRQQKLGVGPTKGGASPAPSERTSARGSGFSEQFVFLDEPETRKAIRGLSASERLRLLRIVLESVVPGDISSMQAILAKYAASTIDIVGRLPTHLGAKILATLNVRELLDARLVSQTWDKLIEQEGPYLWRNQVLAITATDTAPPKSPSTPSGWFALYRALHHREANWKRGLAQEIVQMKGHTGFVTSLKKCGDTVVTGSYDETIRIWNASSGKCLMTIPVAGSIACLDYLPSENIVACGCHDVGRVYVISTLTGNVMARLSGHNAGMKAVTINDRFLVSAGMDKALVVWDWRNGGKKIIRFGQQTNVNIGIALVGSKIVSLQVDGTVRTFDIETRALIGQFTMKDLLRGYAVFKPWLKSLSLSSTNVVMWFSADENRITLGTLDFRLYFRWQDDFTLPPTLLSFIPTTSSTNDLSVGVSDPSKQRVLSSVRFASRSGTDRRIYIGHFAEDALAASKGPAADEGLSPTPQEAHLIPVGGAWQDTPGLNLPEANPMTLACDNERVIVGCTSGLVYTISFVGYRYRRQS